MGAGVPLAEKLNTTVLPVATVWGAGWLVADGAADGVERDSTVTEYGANESVKLAPAFVMVETATSGEPVPPWADMSWGIPYE